MNKEINPAFLILISLIVFISMIFVYEMGKIKGIKNGYDKACLSYMKIEYKQIKGVK